MTGSERQQAFIAKWDERLTAAASQDWQKRAQEAERKGNWWRNPRRNRLQSDHKYPASKIKKDANFQEVEKKDVDAARSVMTAPFNMTGRCARCNPAKSDTVDPDDPAIKAAEEELQALIRSGGYFH